MGKTTASENRDGGAGCLLTRACANHSKKSLDHEAEADSIRHLVTAKRIAESETDGGIGVNGLNVGIISSWKPSL